MECPNCGAEMKFVAAGVSKKTGKPYTAFYSCPNCKNTVSAGGEGGTETVAATLQKRPYAHGVGAVSDDAKRKWGKSKALQISLQGLVQAFPGKTLEELYSLHKQIEKFADAKVGFNRDAESDEEVTVEDIPF